MSSSKVWFITGASRGFGREWAIAALERGDRVAATARDASSLDDLAERYGESIQALQLDVNDRDEVFAVVAEAHEHFGQLDVIVNNAGYGQFGAIEEVTETQARDQFDTNVFGALWVTQAALPFLRERGSGHFLQVSSIGGISSFANVGIYNSSKWALEGFSEALAQEVAGFGIHVTLIEPGGFDTDWGKSSAKRSAAIPAYDQMRAAMAERRKTMPGSQGDPTASARAVLAIVDAPEPPLRVFFGSSPLQMAKADYARRIETWEKWDHIAQLAQG